MEVIFLPNVVLYWRVITVASFALARRALIQVRWLCFGDRIETRNLFTVEPKVAVNIISTRNNSAISNESINLRPLLAMFSMRPYQIQNPSSKLTFKIPGINKKKRKKNWFTSCFLPLPRRAMDDTFNEGGGGGGGWASCFNDLGANFSKSSRDIKLTV